MQQTQAKRPSDEYRVEIHGQQMFNQSLHQKNLAHLKGQSPNFHTSQEIRSTTTLTKKPLSKSQSPHSNKSDQSCCGGSSLRRELLRLLIIPLLIVLFLLTIALTFKQNNYQTNDYFYSKNIQINRKIRGVVPPLNQSKQEIFGRYTIGLVQKFNLENRRMFDGWKVEIWRNQSMRIVEKEKQDKCWAMYKLKFYSSSIFIETTESHTNISVAKSASSNSGLKQSNVRALMDSTQSAQIPTTNEASTISSPAGNSTTTNPTSQQPSQSLQQTKTTNNTMTNKASTTPTSTSYCSTETWAKLNEILYESHIWTFAQDNFYLLEFSQIGDDQNGVLIMRMAQKYQSTV